MVITVVTCLHISWYISTYFIPTVSFRVTFSKRFKEYDADGNGNLSRDEIKRLLDGLTNEDVAEQMINDCDQDSDGKITLEEFLRVMQ